MLKKPQIENYSVCGSVKCEHIIRFTASESNTYIKVGF